jgi:hypothetical protein
MSPGERLPIQGATNVSATRPFLRRSFRITGMHFVQAMTMCIVMGRYNLTLVTEEESTFRYAREKAGNASAQRASFAAASIPARSQGITC